MIEVSEEDCDMMEAIAKIVLKLGSIVLFYKKGFMHMHWNNVSMRVNIGYSGLRNGPRYGPEVSW